VGSAITHVNEGEALRVYEVLKKPNRGKYENRSGFTYQIAKQLPIPRRRVQMLALAGVLIFRVGATAVRYTHVYTHHPRVLALRSLSGMPLFVTRRHL